MMAKSPSISGNERLIILSMDIDSTCLNSSLSGDAFSMAASTFSLDLEIKASKVRIISSKPIASKTLLENSLNELPGDWMYATEIGGLDCSHKICEYKRAWVLPDPYSPNKSNVLTFGLSVVCRNSVNLVLNLCLSAQKT